MNKNISALTTIPTRGDNIELTESDDFLLTMYYCDHLKFAAFCDQDDCDRIDYLEDILSCAEISSAIERYNLRTFGITSQDCKDGACLFCKDNSICDGNSRCG